ncbi:uncharacterized protein AC631_03116 [Debaryomyces fabryi]|uniref:Maintenance of telomere capping protein 1 n=1 Tax=Debaryomyces fabryi TaxID=58627 RepID=A0A0V1PXY3_9ASCO|nr:uncharacterized protein AC631_03116 [Debaryomyces fabryi]KSA01111.1 hypothetical protein AC631_03116 [Debaryomyces fabryi]CUM55505.1 unnamed protein product [Debaryomyces fabryi]
MSPKTKTNDTDDVLDFINSLPDSKSGTPKPKETSNNDVNDKDEDFLEFLDELAAHEKSKPSTPKPNSKFEPKKKGELSEKESKSLLKEEKESPAKKELAESSDNVKEGESEQKKEITTGDADLNKTEEIDPIGSISTWWNNEGSNKVSSFWGSITSNAQSISEQTYHLASTTSNQISQQRQKLIENSDHEQIINISSKLNSMLLNMSQQITQGLMSDTDELLNILLIYDLYNINYLDRLCYDKFNQVMNQVEGGINVSVNNFNHKDELNKDRVDLNLFYGKIIDGEKLCLANLESSVKDYLKITKLSEEEDKKSSEPDQNKKSEDKDEKETKDSKDEIDKINKSNIFISIQPITSRSNQDETNPIDNEEDLGPILIESNNSDSFSFTIILKDITNNITIITKTQPFPLKWAKWLSGELSQEFKEFDDIDPSEWVKNWIKDGLSLSFGVLAQEYVIKRMGF